MKNTILKTVAFGLALVFACIVAFQVINAKEEGAEPLATRMIELEKNDIKENLSVFEDYAIREDEGAPNFTGVTEFANGGSCYFEELSYQEEGEGYHIKYDCTFDMDKFQYIMIVSLLNKDEEVEETETIITDAFVTENGGIDANIEIGDKTYLLSEYREKLSSPVEECLFGWLVAAIVTVVVTYVVVAETAEQIQCKKNYEYNKSLESKGNGVYFGKYIYYQKETDKEGSRSGNYHFGFTTFGGVGCEVAAAYNAMIALGKPEMLSETINCFEKWMIEFSIGFGNLGSNPLDMTRYFNKKGIQYYKYGSISSLKNMAESKNKCYIIMSRWNAPFKLVLHTFYVEKTGYTGIDAYHSCNWGNNRSGYGQGATLDVFNNGSGFIVGYILWI